MAVSTEKASWNDHKFVVSANLIRGFTKLRINGSCETEDKTKNSENYAARKNSKPTEITLTVQLNAYTGCDVRTEALQFITDAEAGKKDYFYIGGTKLIPAEVILVTANIADVSIAPNDKWTSAMIDLTFKKTGTGGTSSSSSGGSGSSGGSQKASVYSQPVTTKKVIKTVQRRDTSQANQQVKKVIQNAKVYSTQKKIIGGGGHALLQAR